MYNTHRTPNFPGNFMVKKVRIIFEVLW